MPSDWPPASTAEANAAPPRLSSPRWKKPSSGPLPRTGHGSQGLNLCPRGPMPSRSELKRRLRASAEAAALVLAEAKAARGSHATVPVEGGLDDLWGVDPAGVRGTVPRLWSGGDEVTLLAAAAAFRERTGRAPRLPDAGALFDAIKGSISPDIDEGKAYDRLNFFENEFLRGTPRTSDDPHGCRVRELCAGVWGAIGVVRRPPPDDDSDGEEDANEGRLGADDADERHLGAERTSKPAPLPRLDAQTPPEAPSAFSMDVDVVSALPSPSRSMKLSFHPQPGIDDGHPGRVPSPCRLGMSADIAALAHAATAAARGSDDTTVHHDVQSHGTADAPRLERADHGAGCSSLKVWSDADEVALLKAAVAFRELNGRVPRVRDAGLLLCSIKGSISPHIDEAKAYYKLGRLKRMFRHEAPGECATAHDHRVHYLSAKVWGVVAHEQVAVMPVVGEMLGRFWKANERAMAGLSLEKGLSLLGKREARLIEAKWRQQLDEEMQTQMQRHDLAKEVCDMLYHTIMDLGP